MCIRTHTRDEYVNLLPRRQRSINILEKNITVTDHRLVLGKLVMADERLARLVDKYTGGGAALRKILKNVEIQWRPKLLFFTLKLLPGRRLLICHPHCQSLYR